MANGGAAYQRVLLKLSGEALMGDESYGIDEPTVQFIAGEIKAAHELGIQESAASKRYVRALERAKQVLARLPGGREEAWTRSL